MNANLLVGAKVRLTALNREDARTVARWSEDTQYLRLADTHAALPKSEAQFSAGCRDCQSGASAHRP